MTRFFAALYVSETWYSLWERKRSLHGKARALVLFDRIIAGQDSRLLLNGGSLDDLLGKVEP